MNPPENWLQICVDEVKRSSLISLPRKLVFMKEMGMTTEEELHEWMRKTYKNFKDMVTKCNGGKI